MIDRFDRYIAGLRYYARSIARKKTRAMNVDMLISELLLREDRREEVQVLLPTGETCPIRDLVSSKAYHHEDSPIHSVTLIRLDDV